MVTLSGGRSSWRKAEDDAATLTKGRVGKSLGSSYPLNAGLLALDSVLPTERAQDEVHDKEGAEEDEGTEVDPRPR